MSRLLGDRRNEAAQHPSCLIGAIKQVVGDGFRHQPNARTQNHVRFELLQRTLGKLSKTE